MNPLSKAFREHPRPIPEYGGMRVDPHRYPLVYNRIVHIARQRFGDTNTKCLAKCTSEMGLKNCCPEMLTRMEVGAIRYATSAPEASALMQSSTVTTQSKIFNISDSDKSGQLLPTRGYKVSDIGKGIGSPYDKCLLLLVAANQYYNVDNNSPPADGLWKTGIDSLCDRCTTSGISGMCALCQPFNGTQAQAAISCTGYDFDVSSAPLKQIMSIGLEVTDATLSGNLHLLNIGFQNLVTQMIEGPVWSLDNDVPLINQVKNRGIGVAPIYGKELTGVRAGTAQSTSELVERQIHDRATASAGSVRLDFADGSSTSAKAAYLTMLPYDLAALEGFGKWAGPDGYDSIAPMAMGAMRMVLGWRNISESLGARLGLKSCVEGLCERLILDGPSGEWMPRQVWLWDPQTIMLYEIAGYNTTAPANAIAEMAREKGMDATISTIMKQIRTAVDLPDLANPDWARLKKWKAGTLMPGWSAEALKAGTTKVDELVDKMSRPLGKSVPLFYGNSEASKDGDLHGWAEGSLKMVEAALPDITKKLGLTIDKFDPTNQDHMTTMAIKAAMDRNQS